MKPGMFCSVDISPSEPIMIHGMFHHGMFHHLGCFAHAVFMYISCLEKGVYPLRHAPHQACARMMDNIAPMVVASSLSVVKTMSVWGQKYVSMELVKTNPA